MRAALIHEYQSPLVIEQVNDPVCPRDGVVLRVLACGVCRSDHHAWQGHDPDVSLPQIPGHEYCGEILETGDDVGTWSVGDRVIAPFVLGCGNCHYCNIGESTACATQVLPGFNTPGAFAELIAVPRADFNLARLPQRMSAIAGAALGCRVTTSFRALVDRAAVKPGEWVVVFGCGGIGLSCIQLAHALGARSIAVDIADNKLALARRLGAEHALNASGDADIVAEVTDLTGGGAHVAIEALGQTQTFSPALMALAPLGRLVQIGMPCGSHRRPSVALDRVYSHQLALYGTRGMPSHRFADLFTLIETSGLDVGAMIEERIGLDGVNDALNHLTSFDGAGIRVIEF